MPFTNSSPITEFPQGFPSISGVNVTLSVYLQNPARVEKAITDFSIERFVTDKILAKGPTATGGAVVFDQVTGTFFFLDRDVQEIRPGSQFPVLAGGEQLPSVATVRKLGGEVFLTYEAIRRDKRNLLVRETQRLANTTVRYTDATTVAALNAAPIYTATCAAAWNVTSDPLADIANAAVLVYGPDLGYMPNVMLMNPTDHATAVANQTLRLDLPRENLSTEGPTASPIYGGKINMLEGLTFYLTNRVPQGTGYILQAGVVGSYSDEIPEYYRTIDEPREESVFIHGARIMVPYITDPKACVKLTGI
jgi:hypothetical protein